VRVDPETNRIFIIDSQNSQFFIFDAEKQKIVLRIEVAQAPIGMALNSQTGMIYVLSEKYGNVTVIDSKNGKKIAVFITGEAPKSIMVNEKTNKVYVANYGDNTLSIINVGDSSIKKIEAGQGPTLLAADQEENLIFVVNEINRELHILDAATEEKIAQWPLGLWPKGLVADAVNKRIYISNFLDDSVTILDYSDPKALKQENLKTGKGPFRMVADINSRELYVVNYSDAYLSVFDKQGREKSKIELGEKIISFIFNQFAGQIYAVGKDEPAKLKIYDIASRNLNELTLAAPISGLASVVKNEKIYASQFIDGRLNLAVIDAKTKKVDYYPLVYKDFIYENRMILAGAGILVLLIAVVIIIYLFFIKKERADRFGQPA